MAGDLVLQVSGHDKVSPVPRSSSAGIVRWANPRGGRDRQAEAHPREAMARWRQVVHPRMVVPQRRVPWVQVQL
ncbi:hypothetical protein, partial [Kribbella antibiotica]|uniref:hypothetical protein n=1 Tax=Kribbella antibiotica TaxID=190195 RepID=UPI001EE0D7A7